MRAARYLAALLTLGIGPAARADAPGSRILFPAAAVNARGDYVMAYRNKITVSWGGTDYGVLVNTNAYFPKLFTAAISQDTARPAATICAGKTVWEFAVDQLGRGSFAREVLEDRAALRCTYDRSGELFMLDAASKQLLRNRKPVGRPLPLRGDQVRFVSTGDHFTAVDEEGTAVQVDRAGNVLAQDRVVPGFESHWNVAGGAAGLIAADSFGTYELRLGPDLRWSRTQIPATPCEEKQVCGLSYADDGTWFVVGYWGAYLGRGRTLVRVPVYNLPGKFAGVAAAHSGEQGRFVFFGLDTGDRGELPALPRAEAAAFAEAEERSLVWLKRPPVTGSQELLGKVRRRQGEPLYLAVERPGLPAASGDVVLREGAVALATRPPAPALAQGEPTPRPWWRDDIELPEVRARIRADRLELDPVRVAIVDTGLDVDHPWSPANLWQNDGEVPGNGIDDDGNGVVDDVYGYDFVHEDPTPEDPNGHGTHVAALVAGRRPGGESGWGAFPEAEVMIARAFGPKGNSNSIDLARAVTYVARSGAELVNCSWGGGSYSLGLADAFRMLRESGAHVLSSAGNSSIDTDRYPQVPLVYPRVVGVGASTPRGRRARFSNFGETSVLFMAPGLDVLSASPGGGLGEMSGTSMSSGIASGAAALLLSLEKRYGEGDFARVLEDVCESARPGPGEVSQCGRLDLLGAFLRQRQRLAF
jgi:hypothetical protein